MDNKSDYVTIHESDGDTHVCHRDQLNVDPNKDKEIKAGEKNDKIRKYINELKSRNGWEDEVDNILMYDKDLIEKEQKEFDRLARKKKIPAPKTEKVYVDTLKTRQPYLDRKKLINFLSLDFNKIDDPIKAVRYDGEVILLDGNHRAAISKLRSQKQIEVSIIDLDSKKWKWR